MGLNKKKLLGIGITTNTRGEILEEVRKRLKQPTIIVTPNPEQIVLAQDDTHYAQILNNADIAIPDGIGVAWAIGGKRIPGVELMEDLVELAVKEGATIGLIGGWHGVAFDALECLHKKYPGLRGWAREPENVKDGIYPDADIVFVGLGAPKQEYFIEELITHNSELRTSILMAVGGAFDILAGRRPRAPFLLRAIGLEWLWRLAMEPWRWRRQRALLRFFWLARRGS